MEPPGDASGSAVVGPAIARANPLTPDTAAAAPPGSSGLVSPARNGGFANGPSSVPSISENGRWVAFTSLANNLVQGDSNDTQDVFLRDRSDGTTVRLPLPGGGAVPAGGTASEPAISADGSVVAFTYTPPAPAPPPSATPTPTPAIILLAVAPCSGSLVIAWHRDTGASEIASITADDTIACRSSGPSVSGDGTRIAFVQLVNLGAAGVAFSQVFVRDVAAGTTTYVSGNPGAVGNANSRNPAISGDGRVVAFDSDASNLVAGDAAGASDVFARRLPDGPIELISRRQGGSANGPSLAPSVSADGSVIAFESNATNLAPGAAAARNVYVRDRSAGVTSLASVDSGGTAAAGDSGQASISGDGSIVAFASVAADLALFGPPLTVSGPNADLAAVAPPKPTEVYAHDLVTGHTIRVSEARGGGAAGGVNLQPSVGGNGRYVAFTSTSPNIVRGDGNQVADVFLRDFPAAPAIAPDPLEFGPWALGIVGPPLPATVSNAGWAPVTITAADVGGSAAGDFSIAVNDCQDRVLRFSQTCQVSLTFAAGKAGERNATLEVEHFGPKPPAVVAIHGVGIEIPGVTPGDTTLEIKPPVGRPGIVVIVTGSGLPGNTDLTLAWSRGITPKLPPIRTDVRGNFRVQVLVFHNDVIGPRDLVATTVGPVAFPPISARFLVVEPPSEPPRFEPGDPSVTRPQSIIFRR